ncbi:MAG: hypothetical protein RXO22_04495 [Thermocladium sp.]|jgi:uncharacterized membrane protein YesL|nr:MAG: hypothetical protein AT710_00555 [Thermocladium sp. ECH_B]
MKRSIALELAGLALMPIGYLISMLGVQMPGLAIFMVGYAISIVEMLFTSETREEIQVRKPSPSDLKSRPTKKPGE